jgi:hypothetical protein
MNALGRYKEENGLTDDNVASTLSALLGKKITPQGVKLKSGKGKVPQPWAEALGLELGDPDEYLMDDTVPLSGSSTVDDIPMASSEPPRAPSGARFAHSPRASAGGDYAQVRERIAKAYGAIGAGAAMVSGNQGYAEVTNAYSNDLAQAWVNAARENKNVAKIVEFMNSGGPVGELVMAHIILVLGFAYVSGRGPQLDFLYADKFGRYRAAAVSQREAEAAAEGYFDGPADQGAAGFMGDTQ